MSYQIQQSLCSCCHRCRVECPVGAIRFRNSKYWIDPEKCVECGHCVEVCHNDVISAPTGKNPPEPPKPHLPRRERCDVLVIGGGASGLAAAARAATLGKQVLVLEKNKEIGGSAWYAHVFRSYWSKWHEEAGMQDPRDAIYREFMKEAEGHVNGKIVRRILDADTDFVNWLIENFDLGRDFTFGPLAFGGYGLIGTYDWPYNHKRIDTTIGPGGTGWYMVNKLLSVLLEKGGRILYRTGATELITDERGRVTGAVAEDSGGKLEIRCESCIVAAGTYSRNPELVRRFRPEFYGEPTDEDVHIFSCATCTGDGITMCERIGADIDFWNARTGMYGPMRHPFGTASIGAACSPYGFFVQTDGSSYEEQGGPKEVSDLAELPGRFVWRIMDEAGVALAEEQAQGRTPDVVGIDMDQFYRNWREELTQECRWGTMYRAETLGELARKIGADPDRLKRSAEEFNHLSSDGGCHVGPKGPFYAFKMKMFHENGIGGIVIDENMRVLRNGRPVPNLYAAGDNTRGEMVHGAVGVDYIERTISALTFALCSGYLAGAEAASAK